MNRCALARRIAIEFLSVVFLSVSVSSACFADSEGALPVKILEAVADITVDRNTTVITLPLKGRFIDPMLDLVRFETVSGTFDVLLYEAETPGTVANFLNYVDAGAYNDTFIHRSMPGFVIQGGGFAFTDFSDPSPDVEDYRAVPSGDPISNEPGLSNVRGTIAMAKLGGDPDSATHQWFINLADNSANLDAQNGGFTVFGKVVGEGMAVVDAIASVPVWNADVLHTAFSNLPLIDYENTGLLPDENDLVMVHSIEKAPELRFEIETDHSVWVSPSIAGGVLTLQLAGGVPGSAQMVLRAVAMDGRMAEDVFTVRVSELGDCNGDGWVDLADGILALKILTGDRPVELRADYPQAGADVNGDKRIGLEEFIYILKRLARFG